MEEEIDPQLEVGHDCQKTTHKTVVQNVPCRSLLNRGTESMEIDQATW